MTRRDKCDLIGRRAALLNTQQAALAWHALAVQVEDRLCAFAPLKIVTVRST